MSVSPGLSSLLKKVSAPWRGPALLSHMRPQRAAGTEVTLICRIFLWTIPVGRLCLLLFHFLSIGHWVAFIYINT